MLQLKIEFFVFHLRALNFTATCRAARINQTALVLREQALRRYCVKISPKFQELNFIILCRRASPASPTKFAEFCLTAWFIKFRLPSNFVEFRLLLEFLEFY